MQHERDPFGGRQPVEDHQQGEADLFGQQRLVLGVTAAADLVLFFVGAIITHVHAGE